MDALFAVPEPRNEPVRDYAPGSAQVTSLQKRLGDLASSPIDLTMTIDGAQRMAGGEAINVVQPHKHAHVLGITKNATHDDARDAVAAAKNAAPMWRDMSYADRAAITTTVTRNADMASSDTEYSPMRSIRVRACKPVMRKTRPSTR